MAETKELVIEDLAIRFADDPYNDSIIVTLPCGCDVKIMSRARGGVRGDNEPFQFKSHCNTHYW